LVQKVDLVGTGSSWSANVFAVPGANGTTTINLTAIDEFGTGTGSFKVSIAPVDDPPTIAPLGEVTTFVNISANARTTIGDPDTAISALTFSFGTSNPQLVKSVLFSIIEPNTLVATIIPERDMVGQASVTLFVDDGTTKVGESVLFTVIVPPNDPPTLAPIADQRTPKNVPAFVRLDITDPDTEISAMTITAIPSNTGLIQSATVGFTTDGAAIVNIRPKADQLGQSSIQVFVNDGATTVSRSFILTVFDPPNEPPVLGTIPDQTTLQNQPVTVVVPVTDQDTPIGDLVLTGVSSNPDLLKPIAFSNDGVVVKALINPLTDKTGTSTVTITVNDGRNTLSTSFVVTVKSPTPTEPPVLGTIASQTTAANQSVTVVVPVTDPDTAISALVFTGVSSNPDLLKPIAFSNDGTVVKALISPLTDKTGTTTVTITADDGEHKVSTSFVVTVGSPTEPPTLLTPVVTTNPDGSRTITVTWTGGGELETAPSATGPWTKTGNTSGSLSEPATGLSKFYRVARAN